MCSFTVVGGEVKAQAEAMQADAEAEERKAAAREVAEEDGEEFDEEADYSRPATVTDETFIAEKDFVTCTVTVERENLPLAQHYERRSDDGEDAPLVVRSHACCPCPAASSLRAARAVCCCALLCIALTPFPCVLPRCTPITTTATTARAGVGHQCRAGRQGC